MTLEKLASYFVALPSTALALSLFGTTLWAAGNAEQAVTEPTSPQAALEPSESEGAANDRARLLFRLKLERKVYFQSDWGHPPQLVIWLEQPGGRKIKTLWVTHRTGAGEWRGKADCPVSLPYWVSRYNRETNTTGPPTSRRPVPDAISQPTPKNEFQTSAEVPRGSTWDYFIEVNVSGDFNRDFPSIRDDNVEDAQGNGQPSLIYRGRITAEFGARSAPKLVGRTHQFEPVDHVIRDLDGVTGAKQLLSVIEVSCTPAASVGTASSSSRHPAPNGNDDKAENREAK